MDEPARCICGHASDDHANGTGKVPSSVVSVRRPTPSIWSGTRLMLLSVLVGVVILGALVVLLLALWGAR